MFNDKTTTCLLESCSSHFSLLHEAVKASKNTALYIFIRSTAGVEHPQYGCIHTVTIKGYYILFKDCAAYHGPGWESSRAGDGTLGKIPFSQQTCSVTLKKSGCCYSVKLWVFQNSFLILLLLSSLANIFPPSANYTWAMTCSIQYQLFASLLPHTSWLQCTGG